MALADRLKFQKELSGVFAYFTGLLALVVSKRSVQGLPKAAISLEIWRKAAEIEPARERMPSTTGFEARPRHRARLPSFDSWRVGIGQRVVVTNLP